MAAPLPARIAICLASSPRLGRLLHDALLANHLSGPFARIHRAQMRRELEDLAARECKRFQTNRQLRPSGDPAAAFGLR